MRKHLVYIKSEAVQSSSGFEENRHVLEDIGIDVTTLPAISFQFKNLDKLRECLENPAAYSGLILTSVRTVEAIVKTGTDLEPWKDKRNYCVGQTTLNKVESDLGSGWTMAGGGETGNADLLSDLILSDLSRTPTDLPFLFPCSNLALGTLVNRLTTAGYKIQDVEVYETVKHEDLDERVQKMSLATIDYILFFSPSTVQYFMESVRKAGLTDLLHKESLKLIAIGPSTSQEMQNQGLSIFATLSKPNIESLVNAIQVAN